jgi:hypothetical protein
MAYSYPEIRKFLGLFLQANSFEVPDGAMEVAENVLISNDNQIVKFPGFHTYYTPGFLESFVTSFGEITGTGNYYGVFSFSNSGLGVLRNLEISSSSVNIASNGTVITGEEFWMPIDFQAFPPKSAVQSEIRYFTAANGTFRIETLTGFTESITKSGVPPGLDLEEVFRDPASSGPLPAGSQTSYRFCFGRRDNLGKVLLGAPSDILTIVLPEGGSGVSWTRAGVGPYQVTVTKTGHGLETGQEIEVTVGSNPALLGTQTVSFLSADTFSFTIAADPGASGTLTYTYSRAVGLQTSIPSEIDNIDYDWFIQLYRTSSSVSTNALPVTPTPDFALIFETNLSQTDIDTGIYYFFDEVDPILAGAELYTNPNSQEGELQANTRPPAARDICNYKNYMIYAGVTQRSRLQVQLVDTSNLTFFYIDDDGPQEIYDGFGNIRNQTLKASSVSGSGTVTITYTGIGSSFANGWTVLISQVTGTVLPGLYVISNVTASTFDITPGGGLSATALYFEGVLDAGGDSVFFVDTSSSSIAVQIETTARSLVKAINRRPTGRHYANYRSGPEDAPGFISVEQRDFPDNPLNSALNLSTVNSLSGNPFNPPLTTSGLNAPSVFEVNNIYVSKFGEADAVPLVNFFPVGTKSSGFLQAIALEDAVIFIKEDGVFRLTGETINEFSISTVDPTNFGLSARGAARIAGTIIGLTNQGICEITPSGVTVLSRRIDDAVQKVVGNFRFSSQTDTIGTMSLKYAVSVGFEPGRLWLLSIPTDNGSTPAQTYIYNVVNQTWSTTEQVFSSLAMGPQDRIYCGNSEKVKVLRRYSDRIDYSREYCIAYASSDSSDSSIVYFQLGAGPYSTPKAGDIIVYDGKISHIASLEYTDGNWRAQMMAATNIPTTSTTTYLYEAYTSTVRLAPFHAGQVGRAKQFSQMTLSTRQFSISRLSIDFQTNYFLASDATDWYVNNILDEAAVEGSGPVVVTYGWGNGPWGLLPWGAPSDPSPVSLAGQSVFLDLGTQPSVPLRTYVPLSAQRSAFIQPVLTHAEAGEPMLIQSVSWCVRGYGEKITR